MSSRCGVVTLHCAVQKYAWGKLGNESKVSQLISSACPHFKAIENEPYAELWMGTHVSGPSVISTPADLEGMKLKEWLQKHPEHLGPKVSKAFGNNLPFLFKVLSVNKALSIQAHPDKPTAEKLHRKQPNIYKDPNHKPEMAIALTKFEALCGFRPISEIKQVFQDVPELKLVIGQDIVSKLMNVNLGDTDDVAPVLKECFTKLMTAPEDVYREALRKFCKRLDESGDSITLSEVRKKLFQRIYLQFPEDIGCFGMFFFNYVVLKPGEAIFLAANEPHAYLSGDCIECMACSDNVVRAGLTPKYVDVGTLCNILSYRCRPAIEQLFQSIPDARDSHVVIYNPPVPEFAVQRIQVPSTVKQYTLKAVDSGSVCLVTSGEATVKLQQVDVRSGSVFFVPADETVDLVLTTDMTIYRAYTPL